MSPQSVNKKPVTKNRWLERLMAILALINLLLVFFNLSYVPNRLFYWQTVPVLTQLYDPIKEIRPHPETQSYLERVDALDRILLTDTNLAQTELLLSQLRSLSQQIIEENPFAGANGSSVLEKIKEEMRRRVGTESALEALTIFWTRDYLATHSWQEEMNFFDIEIRPLLETNYYRDLSQYGRFVDRFWLIDLPFVILFALDYLIRSYFVSRRNPQLNWLEAMLRRWYDLLLLVPTWRWMRVLPVIIRLYQARLVNLEPIRAQINYDFAVNFAEDITKVVGVRIIDQIQEAVASGEVAHWIFHPESRRPYHTVNDVDEIKAIATRLIDVSVYDVLPQVQPEVEAIIEYSLQNSLHQLPAYRQLQKVPGLSNIPNQMLENLVHDLSGTFYSSIAQALQDPVVGQLSDRLINNFRDVLESELQKKSNLQELESWLIDMLEEIKINYVKGIDTGGIEKIKQETDRLHNALPPSENPHLLPN